MLKISSILQALAVLVTCIDSAHVTFLPLPAFGVQAARTSIVEIVRGLRENDPMSKQVIDEIREALHQNQVVVFRGQGDIPWQALHL